MCGHQPRYTADNDAAKTDVCAVHMSTLSHTSCGMLVLNDEIRTSLIKSTLTCSASPGLNSPTFTWHKVQHKAEAGKHRGFNMSIFQTVYVQIIMCLPLSTIRHLWETRTFAVNRHFSGRSLQFACCNLMTMFCSILRRIPPQEIAQLVKQSVQIIVLCTMLYMNRSAIFSIGRRCRLK